MHTWPLQVQHNSREVAVHIAAASPDRLPAAPLVHAPVARPQALQSSHTRTEVSHCIRRYRKCHPFQSSTCNLISQVQHPKCHETRLQSQLWPDTSKVNEHMQSRDMLCPAREMSMYLQVADGLEAAHAGVGQPLAAPCDRMQRKVGQVHGRTAAIRAGCLLLEVLQPQQRLARGQFVPAGSGKMFRLQQGTTRLSDYSHRSTYFICMYQAHNGRGFVSRQSSFIDFPCQIIW